MLFKLDQTVVFQIIPVLIYIIESSLCKVSETEGEALYLTAGVGESVVFDCALEFPHNVPIPYILQYSKDGIPIFSWSDRKVISTPQYSGRVTPVSDYPKFGKGSVNLTNVRETDAGWYECRLYFPNRSPSSALNGTWYYLEVLGGNLLAVPPTNKTVTEGDTVTFTCITKDKDARVNWYKDEVLLIELEELNARATISPEGSLTITPVSMTDPGNYKCEIINNEGETQQASAYLNVQYKAKILFSPREVYFSYGRPGTLDCHFRANPTLTNLRWEKDGFLFDPYNVQGVFYRRNGSLYFSKVDESHAGEYTCTPYNDLGTEGPSAPIHVVVQRPPIFTITPHNLYLRKTGESIEIPCDALDGDKASRPTIIWSGRTAIRYRGIARLSTAAI
uniref:Protein turtle n=1 Tax=Cacopsylla melanoneura TaxID=428564 RepID=A0A8D8WF01_9HEMI